MANFKNVLKYSSVSRISDLADVSDIITRKEHISGRHTIEPVKGFIGYWIRLRCHILSRILYCPIVHIQPKIYLRECLRRITEN